jgi:hypothetical protein
MLALLVGCTQGRITDKKLEQNPLDEVPCPTDLQELSEQVFRPSCTDTGCHGSVDRAGDLDLATSPLELDLFGRESSLCAGEMLVVPGDASSSHLIAKLEGTSGCGLQMPIGVPLAPETIDCVAAWIDQLDAPEACESCGGSACVDLQSDALHCGSCETACGGSQTCVDGLCACPGALSACDSACVDVDSDPQNCGTCGRDCGDLVCFAGDCMADCGALTNCDGACVDVLNDSNHCGACGKRCGPGSSCVDGQCQCGGATVSFGTDVQPIFSASCALTGCHSAPSRAAPMSEAGTSLDLSSGNAYQSLLQVTTTCGSVVVPGDPDSSVLIGKLTGTELCNGSQMPRGDGPLAPELIDTIATWICQGAENN